MKVTRAETKINGLHVMEVNIRNDPQTGVVMNADYALVATGEDAPSQKLQVGLQTHGKCSAYPSNWSQRTLDLLKETLSSMEEDLLPRHFKVTPGSDSEDSDESRFGFGAVEEAPQV